MSEPVILVIDDDPVNLKLLRLLLLGEGFTVYTAASAEEALIALEMVLPCLILLDLQLPGMDGLTLTRRLKDDPRWKNVPVLALTSHAMKGDKEKAHEAGCNGYITKPIDTRALPTLLKRYLEAGNDPVSAAHEDRDHPDRRR